MKYFGVDKKVNVKDKYIKIDWVVLEWREEVYMTKDDLEEFKQLKGIVKKYKQNKFKINKISLEKLNINKKIALYRAFKETINGII